MVIASLIVWIAILFLLVIWKSRPFSKSSQEFINYGLANRSFGKFPMSASLLGSYIGGGTIIAFAGRVSTSGLAFIFAPIGIAIAFVVLGFFAKTYRKNAENQVANTPVDRFISAYGENIRTPLIIIYIFILVSFVTVQLYAGSLLISQVFKISPLYASMVIVAVVLPYTWIGGSKGDVITDIAQVIMIYLAIIAGFCLLIFDGESIKSFEFLKQNSPQMLQPLSQGWGWIIAMLVLPLFTIHTDGSIQQRLLLAKDDDSAKKGAFISAFAYLVFGIFLTLIVLSVVTLPHIRTGDFVLIDYALNNTNIIIKLGLSLAILSAVLSTMDSQALLIGLIISNDIYSKIYRKKDSNDAEFELKKGRVAKLFVPISIVIAFGITLLLFSLNNLFLFLSGIWVIGISCFGAPLLALKFPYLKKCIEKSNLIVPQFIWSIFLTLAIIIWQFLKGKDPANMVVPFGVLLVIINTLVLFFVGKRKIYKNG